MSSSELDDSEVRRRILKLLPCSTDDVKLKILQLLEGNLRFVIQSRLVFEMVNLERKELETKTFSFSDGFYEEDKSLLVLEVSKEKLELQGVFNGKNYFRKKVEEGYEYYSNDFFPSDKNSSPLELVLKMPSKLKIQCVFNEYFVFRKNVGKNSNFQLWKLNGEYLSNRTFSSKFMIPCHLKEEIKLGIISLEEGIKKKKAIFTVDYLEINKENQFEITGGDNFIIGANYEEILSVLSFNSGVLIVKLKCSVLSINLNTKKGIKLSSSRFYSCSNPVKVSNDSFLISLNQRNSEFIKKVIIFKLKDPLEPLEWIQSQEISFETPCTSLRVLPPLNQDIRKLASELPVDLPTDLKYLTIQFCVE